MCVCHREIKNWKMDTGDLLGHFTWQEAVMDEIGARFYLMHHACDPSGSAPPRVRLATGEVIHADLIVGADGTDGITREVVERCRVEDTIGEMSFDCVQPLFMTASATISREQLKKDPELDAFTRAECGGPQETPSRDVSHLSLAVYPEASRIRLDRPVGGNNIVGRCVGDAAHPPIHGTASSPCRGFQDIREEQCQTVHETEHTQMRMAWLPPGPREARDHRLQAMMLPKGWDEEDLRMQWEGVSRTFGYNAREAVEWWIIDYTR
ncbi:hypothetical protein BKA82DRAFT_8406 [Pisolithus tinctorius]|uniref:FAD-binding domain-containing protein n=1 Tax=Pisolithus tinctorius Marx 270 TaxID=870435 RepID=A0A0C3PH32_PISTI|nr:hypothetical protein BKA82DRAFT_8406 [Pisolithus tinctorius]KIO07726.1 hypothetical protein M404DRAFT_8406 [Pisolithus tinctorius Marx 270]